MSHPIMHTIGNTIVILLYVGGIPLATLSPHKSPTVVRLEQSIERLERVVARLESEHATIHQRQEQHIHVPLDGAERERLRDQRIRDIANQLMQEPNNAVQ